MKFIFVIISIFLISICYSQVIFENSDYALEFDGVDDYLEIPDTLGIVDSSFTIEFWASAYSWDNIFDHIRYAFLLVDLKGEISAWVGLFKDEGDPGDKRFYFGSNNGINAIYLYAQDEINLNTWYHVACVYDKHSGYKYIYINGKLEGKADHGQPVPRFENNLIGNSSNLQHTFNGIIDEVRIWNIARDSIEIVDNMYTSLIGNEEGLIVYYQLNEANGQFALSNTNMFPAMLGSSDSIDINDPNWIVSNRLGENEFYADTLKGNIPFQVKFTATSSIISPSWDWDFNNDSIVDSHEQNPTWVYTEADSFSVKLIISNTLHSDTLFKENYIVTQFDSIPNLFLVEDVPDDQGGWVKIQFAKSVFDTDTLVLAKTNTSELYTVEINNGAEWIAAASTVAYGKSIYSVLVPTIEDYTYESNGLLNFRIIAGMQEGNYVSNILQGYSVDNLAPSVPHNFSGYVIENQYVKLIWSPVSDEDFQYYQIYRSNDEISFDKFDTTTDTAYIDYNIEINNSYFYYIRAVDHSGNESNQSNILNLSLTGIFKNTNIPSEYYLSQNYPNPFNPQTTIKYGLLYTCDVKITIFDVLGHKVCELVTEKLNAGHHQTIWYGKNNLNQIVSTGIYYYKLEAGEFTAFKKMLFIK